MKRSRLTLSDRIKIESGLYAKRTLQQIAHSMGRSLSTISREIWNNRTLIPGDRPQGKNCVYASGCRVKGLCDNESCNMLCSACRMHDCTEVCDKYHPNRCKKLESPPYVCNTCPERKKCRRDRAYYIAQHADEAGMVYPFLGDIPCRPFELSNISIHIFLRIIRPIQVPNRPKGSACMLPS